jgi:hypothetical protein
MRRGSLRRTGRLLVCAALVVSLAPALRAAQLETEIDEAMIEVGDTTSIKVKLTGDPGDVKPLKYPSVPGLRIEYSGMERSFEYINGKSWSGVKLIFMVTALRKGHYRIPSFVFQRGGQRLQSGEVALTVSAGGSGGSSEGERSASATGDDIKSSMELSSGSAYVGQPIIMRYFLLTTGSHATVHRFNEHPQTKGFAIKMIDDPIHNRENRREGDYEKAHIVTFALIPAGSGTYRVGGGSATISVETPLRRRRDDFFGFNFPGTSRPQELPFDTKPVTIISLPVQGRPENFQGDIGNFTMKADYGPDAVKVYEEKKITVIIEGTGNLVTMTKPYVEKEAPGLKVITEEGESVIKIDGSTLRGSRKFIFTLVPEKAGDINPGRIKFSFFNPDSARYETLATKEISFIAKGDGSKSGARFDAEGEDKKLDLNPLYFVLIVLAVAGTIVFVVLWERKRYSLVANGAGQELEKDSIKETADDRDYAAEALNAAERGDSDGFLKAAEKALDQVRAGSAGSLPEDAGSAVARIREEIYSYKFGRGSVADEDMKRIIGEIGKLKG